jgi:peptide/nickel transport system substrate-binding protein
MTRRQRAILPAVLAAALVAGGCGNSGDDQAATGGGGNVVFSNVAETPTLDPAVAFSSDGFEFVRNVYEGLLEYAPGSTELRPLLATEWTTSDDGLTYTFTLREGVKFQDGAAFDAAAAKKGLERIQGVNQGPATLMSNIKSISAPAADQLVIELKEPDVYFLGKLPKLPVVSPQAIEENATAKDEWAADWFATHSAGTGPYQLASWKRNSAIYLEKYDGYWREFEAGTPTNVTLRVDPDVQTALQLLGQGEIDMMGAVGPDDSAAAEKLDGVKLVEQPSLQVQTVPLNVEKGPMKDPKVREAIVHAFDYDAMVDFYKGFAKPATGPLPTDFVEGLSDSETRAQDLDRARQLLADAGYPDGGFTVTYLGLKGLAYEEFAGTLLQDNLKQLGIDVKQQLVPWPQMVEVQSKPASSAELSFLNNSPLTDDPSYMLSQAYASSSLASKGGYNWSYHQDPELDRRIAELSTMEDEGARNEAVMQLNQEIANSNLALYVAQPTMAQPVREEWDVTYENLDYDYVVRFFYTREKAAS